MRNVADEISIGVGLRHEHYSDALSHSADIDFVEVHAENFYAKGGASHTILDRAAELYELSIHSTALGLGSFSGIPDRQIQPLKQLVERYQPRWVSDHAAFAWGHVGGQMIHGGDLLPVPFSEEALEAMANNVDAVQQQLGRQMLVENLSAYLQPAGSVMSEAVFLTQLCQRTDCKLLIDLNNLIVNAINSIRDVPADVLMQTGTEQLLSQVVDWLEQIPTDRVGEFHLAGCTMPSGLDFMIDDHSQPVSDVVWQVYGYAIERFGQVPTLIEWDTDLPAWSVLVAEAERARTIAHSTLQATTLDKAANV